jgi:hypothetical protein
LSRLFFTLLIALAVTPLSAQNFIFTNGDSLVEQFEINDYSWAHTKIENLSATAVVYKWEIITYNHPESWLFSICDLPYCYTMGEMSGTMYPAAGESIDAFITLNIDAATVDTGFYQIKVWDELLPENPDTLDITMISTPAYSNVFELVKDASPTFLIQWKSKSLDLKNPSKEVVFFDFYNQMGQLILTTQLGPISHKNIPLENLQSGIYIGRCRNNEKTIETCQIYLP